MKLSSFLYLSLAAIAAATPAAFPDTEAKQVLLSQQGRLEELAGEGFEIDIHVEVKPKMTRPSKAELELESLCTFEFPFIIFLVWLEGYFEVSREEGLLQGMSSFRPSSHPLPKNLLKDSELIKTKQLRPLSRNARYTPTARGVNPDTGGVVLRGARGSRQKGGSSVLACRMGAIWGRVVGVCRVCGLESGEREG